MNTHQVAIRNIPLEFREEIHAHLRLFALTIAVDHGEDSYTCAGTLCQVGNIRGIATAKHVWEQLSTETSFYGLAGQAHVALRPDLVQPWIPPTSGTLPNTDAQVPDLAFLRLFDHECTALEAYGKSFFSLDRRLADPGSTLYEEEGYWAVCGAPQTLIALERRSFPSLVYGTYVQQRLEFDSWDYLNIALDLDENPDLPSSFGGVSGGGVWRTRFGTDEAATRFEIANRYRDIFWVGVIFYQTSLEGRSLIAHGPRSIYQRLYEGVSNEFVT
ncbi:MAG TPA: hypothetical protein VH988_05740 [Thermoanaerobaculia bacterium]|jgi:hypothetical protein|nr:hypothetical protein [Thermoanaerobaculia bacterium]